MNAQGFPLLVARLLMALMFLSGGYEKLAHLEGTLGYMASAGVPAIAPLALAAGALELGGGLLLIVGWQARWAALALAGFTVVASVIFHNFWAMPAAQQMTQQLMFMKNIGVVGGLLLVFAVGAGSLSLDARRNVNA